MFVKQESHYLNGPLLSSPVCEPQLTSLMQEIFLVAQNSDDHQLQHNAAWAVSFLRNHLFSKEVPKKDLTNETDMAGSRSVSQSISENSVVMKLSSWLMHLNISEVGIWLQCLHYDLSGSHYCELVTDQLYGQTQICLKLQIWLITCDKEWAFAFKLGTQLIILLNSTNSQTDC